MRQRKRLLNMIEKYWTMCLVSMTLLGLVGCNEIPEEHRDFFRLPPGQIEKAIFNYPLSEQIDLMLIGWTKPHPPLNLYFQVAENGESIVPLLIQRLATVEDMEALRVIAICLYLVDFLHFKWTSNQEYVEKLEMTLAEISNSEIREEIRMILKTGKLHPYAVGAKQEKKLE